MDVQLDDLAPARTGAVYDLWRLRREPMKVILNLAKGLKAAGKTPQMVLTLFLINLALSLVLAVPMYHSLQESFGTSLVGEKMAKGFDYLWWQEFKDDAQGLESTFRPSIIGKGALLDNLQDLAQLRFLELPSSVLILGIIYLIIHTFLAGGIVSVFKPVNPRFTLRGFFQGAGRYFLRFFLLMLFSWVFFLTIGLILSGVFLPVIQAVTRNAISEVGPFFLGIWFSVIILFLFFFVQMVFDYARIRVVLEEEVDILTTVGKSFGFVFRHLIPTLGLYYLIFLSSFVLSILYVLLKEIIPQSQLMTVLLAFLIQQLFMFSLIWVRCWLYSSQMELYRYLK